MLALLTAELAFLFGVWGGFGLAVDGLRGRPPLLQLGLWLTGAIDTAGWIHARAPRR